MNRAAATLDEIRFSLLPFFRDHGVAKAIVFGSFARGTQTRHSDLDLAVVMDTERRFLDRYDQVRGIQSALAPLRAEVLVYRPGEIEAISHRPFVRRILEEGVVIYER